MHFVKVTEIMKNRKTREIVLNTANIETVVDEVLARIAIGLGGDHGLKEMRSVRCHMVSGTTIDLKFNGDASECGRRIYTRKMVYPNGVGIPNWVWNEEDHTEWLGDVLEEVDMEEGPIDVWEDPGYSGPNRWTRNRY